MFSISKYRRVLVAGRADKRVATLIDAKLDSLATLRNSPETTRADRSGADTAAPILHHANAAAAAATCGFALPIFLWHKRAAAKVNIPRLKACNDARFLAPAMRSFCRARLPARAENYVTSLMAPFFVPMRYCAYVDNATADPWGRMDKS